MRTAIYARVSTANNGQDAAVQTGRESLRNTAPGEGGLWPASTSTWGSPGPRRSGRN